MSLMWKRTHQAKGAGDLCAALAFPLSFPSCQSQEKKYTFEKHVLWNVRWSLRKLKPKLWSKKLRTTEVAKANHPDSFVSYWKVICYGPWADLWKKKWLVVSARGYVMRRIQHSRWEMTRHMANGSGKELFCKNLELPFGQPQWPKKDAGHLYCFKTPASLVFDRNCDDYINEMQLCKLSQNSSSQL